MSGRRSPTSPKRASKKQTLESVWYHFGATYISVTRRLASKKQTLESVWYQCGFKQFGQSDTASKKQTLESVWYRREGVCGRFAFVASKKQTLESVWYPERALRMGSPEWGRLKEADARKRLVWTSARPAATP